MQAYKKKSPPLDTVSLSQWMGASVKILNVLLGQPNKKTSAVQDYLAYIVKTAELIEDHMWQSVILYDNDYQKLQHRHQFCWGSDSQHLHTRFLKKRQAPLTTTKRIGAIGTGINTTSIPAENPVVARTTLQLGATGFDVNFNMFASHQDVEKCTQCLPTPTARPKQARQKHTALHPSLLDTDCWNTELTHDNDRDFLMDGITNGFKIIPNNLHLEDATVDNYRSATKLSVRDQVEKQILTKIQNGNYVITRSPVALQMGLLYHRTPSLRKRST